ncbi:unnamed protein product [Rotaria sp. Silwood2]|nr:unnamed protein product [Rotaria sp. Silwood2]
MKTTIIPQLRRISTHKSILNKYRLIKRKNKIPEGKASHTLYLAGVYRGGHDVLVRAKMALGGTTADPGAQAIAMQLTIRSTDESAVHVIASAVE